MRQDVTPADRTRASEPRQRREPVRSLGWAQAYAPGQSIDVTVCIVNWNCRDLLRACLQSLLEQPQDVSLEVIVVDNGSSDGAAEMVADEFPEVVLMRNNANRGFSTANNQAAARAQGRFLFFLNNDTVVPEATLSRLVEFAENNPEVGMVGPRLRDPSGRLQISYRQSPSVWALLHRTQLFRWTGLLRRAYRQYRRQSFDPQVQRRVAVLMGAAVFLPRHVFDECGGWDERYNFGGEDIDLSFRVNRRRPVIYLPNVEITHHGRVSSRLNISYAEPNVAIGYATFLRKAGTSPFWLMMYKLIVTCDAPVQISVKTLQLTWRRLSGQQLKAKKTGLALQGLVSFLRGGLGPFWRA
ncbi:MAG: glycosyltransferase family 2 protein [Gemmataceae bacterium]